MITSGGNRSGQVSAWGDTPPTWDGERERGVGGYGIGVQGVKGRSTRGCSLEGLSSHSPGVITPITPLSWG